MIEQTTHIHPAIALRGVAKRYGDFPVLKSVDLEVARGSIHGLVGLNGSGKTTTLECMLGLQRFDAGSISLLGIPPSRLFEAEGRIVAIFDSPSLQPTLTVRQSLGHARVLCPNPARSIEEAMALLSITRYAGFKLGNLSLGNKRRVSIAHALLGNPELILLDEPFNGLDAGGVDEVLALIARLNRDLGISFLLSSHQLPYLQSLCSHLSILHGGRIVASGTLESLLAESSETLRIVSSDTAAARRILARQPGVTLSEDAGTEANGELVVRVEGVRPADLNRTLVESGVAVDALIPTKASLDSLFRELTARPSQEARN